MDSNNVQSEAFLTEPLTQREHEIISLIANGLSNREIADTLTVALSTVKWYTKQIYSKMGVNNRKSAVEHAQALGLLDAALSNHTLPTETTKFIGRKAELGKIKRTLKDPGCRLLTLIGLGGVGKTRLAIKAASEIALEDPSLFKDGIHFIPLSAQYEASAIAATIATVLDFSLSGSEEPAKQLVNYLRNKQMLLVLDNFEQLLEGAEQVSQILKKAPKIKLLVTSRETLNLSEEWRFEVVGLLLPETSKADVLANDSAQLFVERASRVRADFSQADNALCISQICHLVDGMPLAIELAASWIRSLSCSAIADEIKTNLDFLETNLRGVPERHTSMRVVFGQSWSQLNQAEKDVYRALSVFSGGFTLAAAKSVVGATPTILTALVDKSLVRREYLDRYQMHELLKSYTAKKLADNAEREREVHDRHSAYYSDLAFSLENSWKSNDQLKSLAIVKPDIYNLLRAWEWSLTHTDLHRLDQMITSLSEFYYWLGHLQDGIRLCRGIQERLSKRLTVLREDRTKLLLVRCKGLLWESTFITQLQNSVVANKRLDAAQELLNSVDETTWELQSVQAQVWLQRGRTAVALGYLAMAKKYLGLSLTAFSDLDEKWGLAATHYWLGLLASVMGDFEGALDSYKASRSLFKKVGDRRNIASTTDALATAFRNLEQYDGVEELHLEAIAIVKELNDTLRLGWMHHNFTWTHWDRGNFHAGAETGRECVSIADDIGNEYLLAAGNGCTAACLLHLGEYKHALTLAESAYSPSIKGLMWQPIIPLTLGDAALALGDFERAYKMVHESNQILVESRPSVAAMSLSSLSLAALSLNMQGEAEAHLKRALSMALETKREIQVRRALIVSAVLTASKGRQLEATRLLNLALESPHFSNSKWYREIAARFSKQDSNQEKEFSVTTEELPAPQPTIWQLAESYLKNI